MVNQNQNYSGNKKHKGKIHELEQASWQVEHE